MKKLEIPQLETERLILEPLSLKHASDEYVGWMNDEEVIKYLDSGGNYSFKALVNYLEKVEQNPIYFWAMIRKDNGRHVGNIKIDPINKKYNRAEYGILIGDRASWGMGFARESTLRVLEFSFKELELNKISLGVVDVHQRAYNLYKKIGFVTEGHFKLHSFHDGHWCNTYIMSIFKDDFLKSE